MRNVVRSAVVCLAVLTLGLGLVPPASAAQGFKLRTAYGAEPHDGAAVVRGSLAFTGRRTYRIDFRANDLCPADGYGTYVRGVVRHMDGSVNKQPWFGADTRGCERRGKSYNAAFSERKRIRYVVFQVCERDTSGSTPRRGNCDRSSRKNNPRTG